MELCRRIILTFQDKLLAPPYRMIAIDLILLHIHSWNHEEHAQRAVSKVFLLEGTGQAIFAFGRPRTGQRRSGLTGLSLLEAVILLRGVRWRARGPGWGQGRVPPWLTTGFANIRLMGRLPMHSKTVRPRADQLSEVEHDKDGGIAFTPTF